jgi:hypothetical protein
MVSDTRYVTIRVQYDQQARYGRSLKWVAPELKDAGLALTEDHLDMSAPSRTWRGVLDGPTYKRFAAAWRLEGMLDEETPDTANEEHGARTSACTLDGMNWEAGGESPIVYVSVRVTPHRHAAEHTAL